MSEVLGIEAFIEGQWQLMGHIEIPKDKVAQGYLAPGIFEYDFTYLDSYGEHLTSNNLYAASLRYPLDYGVYREPRWPAFLLDLIPAGAAREHLVKRLALKDGIGADFELLAKGAINPPGHLRIKTDKVIFDLTTKQPGFSYNEVVNRGIDFIDYAERAGAIVSGSSGAQGVAPKFLLVEDQYGQWHADGAIPDRMVKSYWLYKFPRGKKERDYQIILAESQYYEVARALGLKVLGPLRWEKDSLLIPRFDRQKKVDGTTIRLGLESLISAAGISEFGPSVQHEKYLEIIRRYSTTPNEDIQEYVFRDFLNIVCGNTDNHGRNTSFLKLPNGKVELAPLYDFAPMCLDDSGIPRTSKWKNESMHIPDFRSIAQIMIANGLEDETVKAFFEHALAKLENLNDLLSAQGVQVEVTELATRKYEMFMKSLQSYVEGI